MEFIAERIANLNEHQQIVDQMCETANMIALATGKGAPEAAKVERLLQVLEQDADALRKFEFVLEHRKINYCT